MESDNYLTIKSSAQGIFKEKGSKFIAFACQIQNPDEIKPIIEKLRKEHHEAKHHCFAYVIGKDRTLWRANDDGEPSGTGGRPILGQINSAGLTNILIVVSRYFGGTLLGVSGLINAYRSAAAAAIENAEIISCTIIEYYEISFPYASMNVIMKILKEDEVIQSDQQFNLICTIRIGIKVSSKKKIMERFERVDGLTIKYLETF